MQKPAAEAEPVSAVSVRQYDLLMQQKNIYKKRRSRTGDSKGFINPLAGGERGVTPYGVGRCHEVTEGTGDRWERLPPDKAVNQAQR